MVFKSLHSLSRRQKKKQKQKLKLPSGAESCWGQEESRAAGGARLGATGAGGCGGCFCIFDEKKKNKQRQQKETMTICMPLGMLSTSVPTSSFVTRSRCRGRRSRMLPQQNARLLLSRPHGGDFNGRKQRFLRATTHFSPWAPEARLMLVARRKEPG